MADALTYDFLPWARRGLARAHAATAAIGQPALPQVTVGLQVTGTVSPPAQASVPMKLYGPGDVVGIDPRSIVRTEPRPDARNVEPNYLAAVEFDPPDFPWLLTPARADAQNRLLPWLVLLVLREDELQGLPQLRPGRVLASVTLRAEPAVPLPDLAESWLWAHAQVTRRGAVADPAGGLAGDPAGNLSRIVCPRRLAPDADYIACLVPAFDAGVQAGLGRPVAADATLAHAWAGDSAAGLELPVYGHWRFSTGPAGDFETLARRLKAPVDYAGDPTLAAQLASLGRLPTEVDADRLLQQGVVTPQVAKDAYLAKYQGALLSLSKQQPPPEPGQGDAIAARLDEILSAGDRRALGNLAQLNEDPEVPLVGPPAYGVWHARRHALEPGQRGSHWVDGLNLSIPHRMAAGVGTRVVQTHQESFMQAAWAQAGDIVKAERLLNRGHLASQALGRIIARIARLPPARQLALLAPCAARVKAARWVGGPPAGPGPDSGQTLWAYQRATSLPDQAFDGALRRQLAPNRPALKAEARRQALAQGLAPGAPALTVKPVVATQALLAAYATPAEAARLAGGERFRADGFAGLRALDRLALPDAPGATVTLPGFVAPLPVGQVRTLRAQAEVVAREHMPQAWSTAPVLDRTRGGVLLDSHWQRLGQLASALAADQLRQPAAAAALQATPVTQMARTVLGAGRLQPEGVLVSAERTELGFALAPAQALRVDARSGRLAVGAVLRGVAPVGGARAARPDGGGAGGIGGVGDHSVPEGWPGLAPEPVVDAGRHGARAASAAGAAGAGGGALLAGGVRALKPGQIAAVEVGAVRRLGHAALFSSLPASVVQAPLPAGPGVPVAVVPAVQAAANGLFQPVKPPPDLPVQPSLPGARQSITLLPPERRDLVLDRYLDAWREKIARDAPPALPRGVREAVVAFDTEAAARGLQAAIAPADNVARRLASLLQLGGAALDPRAVGSTSAAAAGVAGMTAGLAGVVGLKALGGREQFVLGALRDRVMAFPHLDEPLYQRLVAMDRSAFMPGVDSIPQDTILLTATNPRFVESCLVGANHEMNRELLWRGFPTDQRGTPFQKFWPYFDPSWVDIQPIHQWPQARPIGQAGGGQAGRARLALVLRGELLRRYPNTNLYAVEKRPGDTQPHFSGSAPDGSTRATEHPVGGGLLPPDVSFFLFDIDPNQAEAFWWVLEEPMTEPRFGFDDQAQPRSVPRLRRRGGQLQHATALLAVDLFAPGQAGDTWLDVDWSELPGVGTGAGQHPHLRLADLRGVRLSDASLQLGANAHAAQVARALLQRPFRGWFAGGRLTTV